VLEALFAAGAGNIGEYSETSFSSGGIGSFRGSERSNPTIGTPGVREQVEETRIEVILPNYLEHQVVTALKEAHPYEEVAYDLIPIEQFESTSRVWDDWTAPIPHGRKQFFKPIK
jgi:hypothetical protein